MKHHVITVACLIGAIVSYAAGMSTGAMVFAAGGLVFESVFWFRLLRRRCGA